MSLEEQDEIYYTIMNADIGDCMHYIIKRCIDANEN